ncbi:MAG: glycosyltransferase family 4 protein, partial [Candidatus Nanoarchaeia archaeon]|nr:glycosyltransferase family 4 protein [Candidatus Nanoarchaeia archaeon]
GIKNKVIIESFGLQDMPNVYNGCDIFVMASQMESFGLAYAEAMACGIPVIGTSVGGIPEIINNNVNGFLIEPKNSVELAKKIQTLLKNPDMREEMGREGVKKIKHAFRLRKMTDRLLGVFKSCLAYKTQEGIKKSKGLKEFLEELRDE